MKRQKDEELPGMYMDNFEVKVVAHGSAVLEHVVKLALCRHDKVESYVVMDIEGVRTLILLWHISDPTSQVKFPAPYKVEQLVPMIMGWLQAQDYGSEPDLDGSCSKGWRIFTNFTGHQRWMPGQKYMQLGPYVVFAVQPEWAEHHK